LESKLEIEEEEEEEEEDGGVSSTDSGGSAPSTLSRWPKRLTVLLLQAGVTTAAAPSPYLYYSVPHYSRQAITAMPADHPQERLQRAVEDTMDRLDKSYIRKITVRSRKVGTFNTYRLSSTHHIYSITPYDNPSCTEEGIFVYGRLL